MASEKYIVIAVVFAITVSEPASKPLRIVNIDDVLNRTVCSIKVEIDNNPDRMPQRIKMIRCAEQPNQYCRAQNLPEHECCNHKHSDHMMECVEVRDKELVTYNNTNKTELYDVIVGCTCMISSVGADFVS